MSATNAAALTRLGAMAVNSGHDDQAARYFREALDLRPDLVEAHFGLGTALFRMDNFAGSVRAFRRAVLINPTTVRRIVCGLIENSRPEPLPTDRTRFTGEVADLLNQFDEVEDLVRVAAKHLHGGEDVEAAVAFERSLGVSYPHELAAVALITAYLLLQKSSPEIIKRLGERSVLREVEPTLAAALFQH